MNLATNCNSQILYASFNYDATCLSLGLKSGLKLFKLNGNKAPIDDFACAKDIDKFANTTKVSRMSSSGIFAYVNGKMPRQIVVYFKERNAVVQQAHLQHAPIHILINKTFVVACCELEILVYKIQGWNVVVSYSGKDYCNNSKGVCALTFSPTPPSPEDLVAFPSSDKFGEIQIVNLVNKKTLFRRKVHDSPLSAIAFDLDFSKVATASEKGTVVRVFDLHHDLTPIYHFRRGTMRSAEIYSLWFSSDSRYLSVCSNLETIHIFKLISPEEKKEQIKADQSWSTALQNGIYSVLPSTISDVIEPERCFASAKLPVSNLQKCCSLSYQRDKLHLYVVLENGYLYVFTVDKDQGGECALSAQHIIDGTDADYKANIAGMSQPYFSKVPSPLGQNSEAPVEDSPSGSWDLDVQPPNRSHPFPVVTPILEHESDSGSIYASDMT